MKINFHQQDNTVAQYMILTSSTAFHMAAVVSITPQKLYICTYALQY